MWKVRALHVSVAYLPSVPGAKVGVDDYLLNHTMQRTGRPARSAQEASGGELAAQDRAHRVQKWRAQAAACQCDGRSWRTTRTGTGSSSTTRSPTKRSCTTPRQAWREDAWQCRELRDTDEFHVTRVIQDTMKWVWGVASSTRPYLPTPPAIAIIPSGHIWRASDGTANRA